ncbi:DUF5672 family protein [Erythrobacter sp. WG]|uniref:DUF5672 family protein n=1 Tax=Erythrobacter sp. WG TaxID=2985510 RepID=UPI00226ECE2E|nr:DUF5672 family protein [Erythrobacter sp. WG]MCX9145739.1 DUF5672 family protein [Erythrobacter sp. WG]
MQRLDLPHVTLVSATSINLDGTLQALDACQSAVRFGAAKLFTHRQPDWRPAGLEVVLTPPLESSTQYSHFILNELADHVETSHCLVIQWDGYVVNPDRWNPQFFDYDYIGASWPQFSDGHEVGNGGFSLRSRRLLEACRSPQFSPSHPEDVAIGRHNRGWLEAQGLRFAPRALADSFAAERRGSPEDTFGFHGVWHMPALVGADRFWELYCGLEDRSSVHQDRGGIMRDLAGQPHGLRRCLKMGWDGLWQPSRRRTRQA